MSFRTEQLAEGVTLILGDCREVLPTLGKFHAVVTDPPYGIGFAAQPTKWQRRAGHEATGWDDSTIARLPELLSLGTTQVVWGGNYYDLPTSRGWLSWFKPDAPSSMGSFELAWTNLSRNTRQITCSISATNAERVGHPTQKPLAVMLWTLREIGVPLSVVDPFMGSGTTGVAAVKLGSAFTGIEIDSGYFDIACKRIDAALKQPDLFVAPPKLTEQTKLFPDVVYDAVGQINQTLTDVNRLNRVTARLSRVLDSDPYE